MGKQRKYLKVFVINFYVIAHAFVPRTGKIWLITHLHNEHDLNLFVSVWKTQNIYAYNWSHWGIFMPESESLLLLSLTEVNIEIPSAVMTRSSQTKHCGNKWQWMQLSQQRIEKPLKKHSILWLLCFLHHETFIWMQLSGWKLVDSWLQGFTLAIKLRNLLILNSESSVAKIKVNLTLPFHCHCNMLKMISLKVNSVVVRGVIC